VLSHLPVKRRKERAPPPRIRRGKGTSLEHPENSLSGGENTSERVAQTLSPPPLGQGTYQGRENISSLKTGRKNLFGRGKALITEPRRRDERGRRSCFAIRVRKKKFPLWKPRSFTRSERGRRDLRPASKELLLPP